MDQFISASPSQAPAPAVVPPAPQVVTPPTVPAPIGRKAVVVALGGVNIRRAPVVSLDNFVVALPKGSILTIYSEQTDADGYIWGAMHDGLWVCMGYGGQTLVRYSDAPAPADNVPWIGYVINDYDAMEIDPTLRPMIRNGNYGPPTVRLNGGKGTVKLTDAWMQHAYDSQGDPSFQFENPRNMKKAKGWCNAGGNVVVQIVMAGSRLQVLRVDGNKAYIKTYFVNQTPPALIIKPMPPNSSTDVLPFSIQYKKPNNYPDCLDLATNGKYGRIFAIANPTEELWIDVRNLRPD